MQYTQPAPYTNDLESVIICCGFADKLKHTLPWIVRQCERVVVATIPEDVDTIALCNRVNIQPAIYPEPLNGGFPKGRIINHGLMNLRRNGWVLHMDADILVRTDLRQMLELEKKDRDSIYGCTRYDVVGTGQMASAMKEWATPSITDNWFVSPPNLVPGTQIVHSQFGWVPAGFFQLWHASYPNKIGINHYSCNSSNASCDDVSWALNWPRKSRVHIPEIHVLHLTSGDCPMGTDWQGRVSQRFV